MKAGDSLVKKVFTGRIDEATIFIVVFSPIRVTKPWVSEELDRRCVHEYIMGIARFISAARPSLPPRRRRGSISLVDTKEETYANATIILRPARVAVLFPAGEHWHAYARLAISVVAKYWGGAGFILVPYQDDGTVASDIIDVVSAYDPDHVVTMPLTAKERERAAPGTFPLRSSDGTPITDPAERVAFLANTPDLPHIGGAAETARALIAENCTPLRQAYPGDEHQDQQESITRLDFEVGSRSGWLIQAVREPTQSRILAVSESWRSGSALSLAIRTGILPNAQEQDLGRDRTEPDEAEMIRFALAPERWSRRASEDLVAAMNVGEVTSDEEPCFWFDEPGGGLTTMRRRWSSEGGAIVIGESAEDFALAYAYERLLGFGVWLTPEMLKDSKLSPTIQSGVRYAGERVHGNAERLTITSSSLNDEELLRLTEVLQADVLDTNPFSVASTGELRKVRKLPDAVEIAKPTLQLGLYQLAVEDPFVTSISVPVSTDQDSTVHMRAPTPTPMPNKPLVQNEGRVKPYWYVSVDLSETAMPRGRGVPQQFVVPDAQHYLHNSVRSSREGLTFHSQGGGLIPAGSTLSSQLYRPRLKVLGMEPWVQAMVQRAGMEASPSLPGMHARLLARRLGGRSTLVSMVSGPYHPALLAFVPWDRKKPVPRSDEVFPERDGVALGHDPYPKFEALSRALPGIGRRDIIGWIDRLAQADLIRRGFILNCSDCTRPSFVGIDQMGQRFECARCSAVNELTATRWKEDTNEPQGFYDLHPTFRELMATNGDVGLFAAQKLQQGSWEYTDTAELEFIGAGVRTRIAEIDLVAHVDGEVVVVEAKSSGRLGTTAREARAAARKKIQIAVALRADRVILATSASRTTNSAADLLREAAENAHAKHLKIEELTSLGPALVEPEPRVVTPN